MIKKFKRIVQICKNNLKPNKIIVLLFSVLLPIILKHTKTVVHKKIKLKFYTPTRLLHYRASSFSDKEPETLAWIDSFENGSVFWDIGANVGLYSVYAAKAKNCKVVAFEPSIFNTETLIKNININNCEQKITLFPLPLAKRKTISFFNLTSQDWGAALSGFGPRIDYRINKKTNYKIPGITLNQVLQEFKFSQPNYLKIDVDGFECQIIQSGLKIINNLRSILIEINTRDKNNTIKIYRILKKYRFKQNFLISKNTNSQKNNQTCNEIWAKC